MHYLSLTCKPDAGLSLGHTVSMHRLLFSATLALVCTLPHPALAQADVAPDIITFSKARVLTVTNATTTILPGTDTPTASQTLHATILEGSRAGTEVSFENDYIQLAPGDIFFLRHTDQPFGTAFYSVADPYRLDVLAIVGIIFVLLAVLIGGMPGIRGIASFAGSLVLIFWLLIPGILGGHSPLLAAIGVSALIIVLGSYITHGFTRTTSSAVLGMIATVLATGLATYWVISVAHLSGFTSEEIAYLNFNTHGSLDMVALLFGGIMIGLLGVLYDIAISQAIAVEELFRAAPSATRTHIFARALRIGREHIGALINTLAIAYVGASLPLLLLIATAPSASLLFTINSELFATEIIRILMGSIGLVLAVPLTTLLAVRMLEGRVGSADAPSHSHSHTHSL